MLLINILYLDRKYECVWYLFSFYFCCYENIAMRRTSFCTTTVHKNITIWKMITTNFGQTVLSCAKPRVRYSCLSSIIRKEHLFISPILLWLSSLLFFHSFYSFIKRKITYIFYLLYCEKVNNNNIFVLTEDIIKTHLNI